MLLTAICEIRSTQERASAHLLEKVLPLYGQLVVEVSLVERGERALGKGHAANAVQHLRVRPSGSACARMLCEEYRLLDGAEYTHVDAGQGNPHVRASRRNAQRRKPHLDAEMGEVRKIGDIERVELLYICLGARFDLLKDGREEAERRLNRIRMKTR